MPDDNIILPKFSWKPRSSLLRPKTLQDLTPEERARSANLHIFAPDSKFTKTIDLTANITGAQSLLGPTDK